MSKAILLGTLSLLALSVAAAPAPAPAPHGHEPKHEHEHGPKPKCNTGAVQCCNQLQQSDSAAGAEILALVGLTAQGLTGMVGSECSPVTAAGIGGGASCAQQPVCCENNSFNGLVAIGCSPFDGAL